MHGAVLIKGILVGFCMAAPVGPINILCMRRTLSEGRTIGFFSGLGAATADSFYGAIAALSITSVSTFLTSESQTMRTAGGIILCVLGIKIFLTKPTTRKAPGTKGKDIFHAYLSTLLLTLTNPTTIFSFAAIFTGLGMASTEYSHFSGTELVIGIFIGSSLWWLFLTEFIGKIRHKLDFKTMSWINKFAGAFILVFSLLSVFK